jgi:hypothetical protein
MLHVFPLILPCWSHLSPVNPTTHVQLYPSVLFVSIQVPLLHGDGLYRHTCRITDILNGIFYSWRKPEYPEKIAVIVTLYHITSTPHYVLICELANFCGGKHASKRERERERERETY